MVGRPPTPVAWRINGERLALVAWLRAILLQLAHPLIAAAVDDHSSFTDSAWQALGRLRHTVSAMLAVTFGTDDDYRRVLTGIQAIHRRVQGTERGVGYSAEDPVLVLWVHGTLIDSLVRVHDRLVERLTEADRDAFCAESAPFAVALGAVDGDVPRTWASLQTYLDATLASGVIMPSERARRLATHLVCPRPWLPTGRLTTLMAAGLLPAHVRDGYGWTWSPSRARRLERLLSVLATTRRIAPRRLARWRAARRMVG